MIGEIRIVLSLKFKMEKSLLQIQSWWRMCLVKNSNIYACLKSSELHESFKNEMYGYHLINKEPIKGSKWEEIFRNILGKKFNIISSAMGNHVSGVDNCTKKWKFSNKTSKIKNSYVSLSSYRLTSVCNNSDIGSKDAIVSEIKKRDKSFDYYSLLLRKENVSNDCIEYFCFIIPKNIKIFSITEMKPYYGKKGNNKTKVIGWCGQNYSIRFSMSSQLWFEFPYLEIEKYKVWYVKVFLKNEKLTYADVYKLLEKVKKLNI